MNGRMLIIFAVPCWLVLGLSSKTDAKPNPDSLPYFLARLKQR